MCPHFTVYSGVGGAYTGAVCEDIGIKVDAVNSSNWFLSEGPVLIAKHLGGEGGRYPGRVHHLYVNCPSVLEAPQLNLRSQQVL
jgi:hypothetical protein